MKRFSLFLAGTALIGLASALPAFADDDDDNTCGPRQRMEQMFTDLDTDKDGKISAAESEAAKKARFSEVDLNGDGKVTAQEMEAHHQKKEAERRNAHFARMDKDGNGSLSADEMEGREGGRFKNADANNDGFITKEEMARAHKEHRGHDRHEGREHHRKGFHGQKGDSDCKVD